MRLSSLQSLIEVASRKYRRSTPRCEVDIEVRERLRRRVVS
jgi:hypothetical protein